MLEGFGLGRELSQMSCDLHLEINRAVEEPAREPAVIWRDPSFNHRRYVLSLLRSDARFRGWNCTIFDSTLTRFGACAFSRVVVVSSCGLEVARLSLDALPVLCAAAYRHLQCKLSGADHVRPLRFVVVQMVRDGFGGCSMHWSDLHRMLYDACPPGVIHMGHTVTSFQKVPGGDRMRVEVSLQPGARPVPMGTDSTGREGSPAAQEDGHEGSTHLPAKHGASLSLYCMQC